MAPEDRGADRDLVVVGGGPAGSAATVFAARAGLDVVVFDRGPGALDRCAYLENYLGFPAGIDVGTFQALIADHVATAGGDRIEETVERVARVDEEAGEESGREERARFRVETDAGRTLTTTYVLAAAWYDGSYLRGLAEPAMFEEQEHHGEIEERFDPTYPDADGRTPVEGLYVASPSDRRSAQAVVAAGNGAHAARSLLADHRERQGYPEDLAEVYDWVRKHTEFSGEWADRDRWREWYDREAGDDHGLDDDRYEELRERYIDEAFSTKRESEAVEAATEAGLARLVETIGEERLLDAIDDGTIAAYAGERGEPAPDGGRVSEDGD